MINSYDNGSTLQGIADSMQMYEAQSCKATIQHALEAASEKMVKEVLWSMGRCQCRYVLEAASEKMVKEVEGIRDDLSKSNTDG